MYKISQSGIHKGYFDESRKLSAAMAIHSPEIEFTKVNLKKFSGLGEGKIVNLFLQCRSRLWISFPQLREGG